jgi:hypothetical protein
VFNIIWQSASVLFGLAAVAAPILIHILVQRRAERVPFPTLRFLQPTRLAAVRRHLLDDGALLAVRIAILAAAVAALAGPLVVTAARRQSWDRRIVRAVVVDGAAPSFKSGEALYLSREFIATSLPDGLRRAVAWLEAAPPARRELVVVSPFAIGSLTAADVAAVPASIGIRFERAGTLPATRTVPAGRVLGTRGAVAREATLDAGQTSVRDVGAVESFSWPIEVVSSPAGQPAVDAAVAAVLSQRVWAPAPDRRARLVVLTKGEKGPYPFSESAIRTPWMADAAASLWRDTDLQTAAAHVATGLEDARFATAPWQAVAISADGRPFAVAAESAGRLVVASAAGASTIAMPLLMRSLANALDVAPDWQRAEVAPIAERLLREWARPPANVPAPTAGDLRQGEGETDRRWLWLTVLCLLGLETWMRRARRDTAGTSEGIARVA